MVTSISPVVDAIKWLAEEYKRTVGLVILLLILFPFVVVGVLYAERMGMNGDVYRQEHSQLKEIISRSIDNTVSVNRIVAQNQGHMLKMLYVQQGSCLNQASTDKEKLRCLPPYDPTSSSH